MNTPEQSANERTDSHVTDELRAANKPRGSRIAALFNAAAALGTLVLIAAASGPKLPKALGD